MKFVLRDRHAEHADPDVELCDHGEYDVFIGDKLNFAAYMGGETIAEFELEWVDKKTMTITMNQLDYLIARAKRER